ncbi:MAG: DUF3047 domain-containing protein [bacterium]
MKRCMSISIKKLCFVGVFLLFSLYDQSAFGQGVAIKLLGDFQEDWKKHWVKRSVFQKPARPMFDMNSSGKRIPYQVVEDKNDSVLRMDSHENATVLWRMINIHSFKFGKIRWRWKVDKSLTGNRHERKKVGDDYAARVCVIFEPHLVSWKTRAIHYVWAGKEPIGSVFKNPYTESVATIVVESGNKLTGKWVSEDRNFVNDYEKIFAKTPEMISAVAIIVDTDNTQTRARAWFDDIVLEFWRPKKPGYSAMPGLRD